MRKIIIIFLSTLFVQLNVSAVVRLHKIFGDGMVLQRNKNIKIWGWASPGERISVSLNKQKVAVRADQAGEWRLLLKPEAAGGPYELQISGHNKILIRDVLLGDIWIASGQSNMEWTVGNSGNAEQEMQSATFDKIRHFKIANSVAEAPLNDLEKGGKWKKANKENVGEFSAVAYFFARKLFKETGVPIGIVNSCWGGTDIETWISAEALSKEQIFIRVEGKAYARNELGKNANPNIYPSLLYNAMIYPLKNLSFKGVIWYQGENNANRASQYQTAFPVMIKDWRALFGQGDFPFYFVQLAGFDASKGNSDVGSSWAELREAQAKTLLLSNTGMATAIDIGEAKDIHPKNKQDVGLRLAAIALNKDYGKKNAFQGPRFIRLVPIGNAIRVNYTNVEGGFRPVNNIMGFEVAGDDQKFYPAKAEIIGKVMEIISEQVRKPIAVRYGWADNPGVLNLFNIEGFAAEPFRSDNWKSITTMAKYEDKFKAYLNKPE